MLASKGWMSSCASYRPPLPLARDWVTGWPPPALGRVRAKRRSWRSFAKHAEPAEAPSRASPRGQLKTGNPAALTGDPTSLSSHPRRPSNSLVDIRQGLERRTAVVIYGGADRRLSRALHALCLDGNPPQQDHR